MQKTIVDEENEDQFLEVDKVLWRPIKRWVFTVGSETTESTYEILRWIIEF